MAKTKNMAPLIKARSAMIDALGARDRLQKEVDDLEKEMEEARSRSQKSPITPSEACALRVRYATAHLRSIAAIQIYKEADRNYDTLIKKEAWKHMSPAEKAAFSRSEMPVTRK